MPFPSSISKEKTLAQSNRVNKGLVTRLPIVITIFWNKTAREVTTQQIDGSIGDMKWCTILLEPITFHIVFTHFSHQKMTDHEPLSLSFTVTRSPSWFLKKYGPMTRRVKIPHYTVLNRNFMKFMRIAVTPRTAILFVDRKGAFLCSGPNCGPTLKLRHQKFIEISWTVVKAAFFHILGCNSQMVYETFKTIAFLEWRG